MALASSIPLNDGTITPTGIVIEIPAPPAAGVLLELWRAPDLAGAPDGANAVQVTSLTPPVGGTYYVDHRPLANITWWYRTRLTGNQYGNGSFTDWVNLGVAVRLDPDALAAYVAGTGVGGSVAQHAQFIGQGRTMLQMLTYEIPNAEFDIWETNNQPHAWTVDTGDSSVAA